MSVTSIVFFKIDGNYDPQSQYFGFSRHNDKHAQWNNHDVRLWHFNKRERNQKGIRGLQFGRTERRRQGGDDAQAGRESSLFYQRIRPRSCGAESPDYRLGRDRFVRDDDKGESELITNISGVALNWFRFK